MGGGGGGKLAHGAMLNIVHALLGGALQELFRSLILQSFHGCQSGCRATFCTMLCYGAVADFPTISGVSLSVDRSHLWACCWAVSGGYCGDLGRAKTR